MSHIRIIAAAISALSLSVFASSSFSQTLTFNDLAPPGGTATHGVNGSYIESGYTLTATGSTAHYTIDPAFEPTFGNGSADGSDYQSFQDGSVTWTLTPASGAFSIRSLDGAAMWASGTPPITLTVTGNLLAGGSVQHVFTLPDYASGATWSNYVLPVTFADLTSVGFDFGGGYVGIDNIVLEPTLTYSVGGTVSGLTGSGLELQNSGTDTLSVAAVATSFAFATELLNGATYAVSVSTQPTPT